MAVLRSTPVRLEVRANAPESAQDPLGQGPDVGRMEGDLWRPGRDDTGRVNRRAWEAVPRNRWVVVADTRLSNLDAQVRSMVPGWTSATLAWDRLFQSWSGFALDPEGLRLWFMGGGHSDGQNNGLYRFDLTRMAWSVEEPPSDRRLWAATYDALNATRYPPSDAAAQAKSKAGTLQPVNDVYWDELPDGKPTARHTYSSMVYVRETQELVLTARRLWRYSLVDKRWTYRRLIRDQFQPWMDAEDVIATHDERTGEVLFSSCGSGGLYRATGYDLGRARWTDWPESPWRRSFGSADTRHGRKLTVVRPPMAAGAGKPALPGMYWVHDLDRRAIDDGGELRFGEGLGINGFASHTAYYDGASVAYLAAMNRYWLFTRVAAGDMQLFELDPTTKPWTLRRAETTGAVPKPRALLKRRMNYWPALNAVTLADNGDSDLYAYRL